MATTFEDKMTQSIEAQRLADRLRSDLETLRGMPLKLMDLLTGLRKQVLQAEVNGQGRLTQAGLQEQIDGLRNKALQAIDDLAAQCQAARDRIEAAVAEAERRQDGDVQGEILRELREQRAWARIKPLLDKTERTMLLPRVQDLAQRAAQDGDDVTLSALEAELPAYLEAQGQASYTPQALAAITQARLPHLPPAARQAIKVRQELAEGWPRLMAAFQMARNEASGRGGPTVALPGWRSTEQVVP
jgi:hypothetical protein